MYVLFQESQPSGQSVTTTSSVTNTATMTTAGVKATAAVTNVLKRTVSKIS